MSALLFKQIKDLQDEVKSLRAELDELKALSFEKRCDQPTGVLLDIDTLEVTDQPIAKRGPGRPRKVAQ